MSKTWLLPNGHARRSINYTTLCSICGFYRFSSAFGRVKTSNKLKINLMRIFPGGGSDLLEQGAEKMIVNGKSHWGKQMKM